MNSHRPFGAIGAGSGVGTPSRTQIVLALAARVFHVVLVLTDVHTVIVSYNIYVSIGYLAYVDTA
jgi:hypothetical protein